MRATMHGARVGGSRAVAPETLLMTDIAESTRLAEKLGNKRWLTIIRAHNGIVRHQVQAHGGREIAHRGDGFVVVFPCPRAAISCAVAVQEALEQRNREHPAEAIRVRIGLHAGRPAWDEGNVYGTEVNITARIADDVARPGQIVVSSRVKELVGDNSEIEFTQGREVDLKGLSGKRLVFDVQW